MVDFKDILFDDTKSGCKIPKECYLSEGKYQIIDQGQNVIAGYTNDYEGIYTDVPAIIFGDHTRIIKYVDKPFFLGADGVKVLKSKDQNADYKYLYYALCNVKIPDTGYNRHFKWLKESKFYYADYKQQKSIVNVLDKLTNLINKRKQQLEKLDELVKSRFVEMFGDPETNPFGWNKVSITTVLGGKVSNGFFAKRDDYIDNGNVSVIGVAYVVNRMYSQVDNIPRTNADENAIKKFAVKYGDMLFCRSSLVAEGIGKASIVPENVPENTLFECHVIRLPLDMQQCVPEYMQTLSTMDYFRNQIIAQSKTATMTTIGQDGILKSHIVLPPIEMQKEFYKFIKLVEKSKAETQKGLEKLELLKNELMQKYFG